MIHESEGRLRPRSKAIKAREGVEIFAAAHKANGFKDTKSVGHETVGGDHGRIVTRANTATHHALPHATFSNTI